jgi:hypothetical protein
MFNGSETVVAATGSLPTRFGLGDRLVTTRWTVTPTASVDRQDWQFAC